jgi:hypothetical protein
MISFNGYKSSIYFMGPKDNPGCSPFLPIVHLLLLLSTFALQFYLLLHLIPANKTKKELELCTFRIDNALHCRLG